MPCDSAVVFYVLGRQGGGKTTICKILANKCKNVVYLGASDLLRMERDRENTPYFEVVNNSLNHGYLAPGSLITALFSEEIKRHPKGTIFLLDGFPREVEQLRQFEDNVCKSSGLIFFDCSLETSMARISGRKTTEKRVDDSPESLKMRLKIFDEKTIPLLDSYNAITGKSKTVIMCDETVDDVANAALNAFERLLADVRAI